MGAPTSLTSLVGHCGSGQGSSLPRGLLTPEKVSVPARIGWVGDRYAGRVSVFPLLPRGSLQREAKAKPALREQVEVTGSRSLAPRANRRPLGDCRKEKTTGELLGRVI